MKHNLVPKVSIYVPTYNRAQLLRQTIEAILAQSYENWELVVGDDRSTDYTEEIVLSYSDPRIRYYKNDQRLGLYGNWNQCLNRTQGEFIAIYHDHDVYLPSMVERSVELLEKHPSAMFVHTAIMLIDEWNEFVDVDVRPFPELMPGQMMLPLLANHWHSPIMAPSAMVRRKAYERVGLYPYEQFGLATDMNMWFRLCQIGDAAYVSEPQMFWRTRTKIQHTGKFRWFDVVANIRMRKLHIETVYQNRSHIDRIRAKLKYIAERERMLLSLMTRAVLLEPPEVIAEGQNHIKQEATLLSSLITRAMIKSERLESFLRKKLLPRHYGSVEAAQKTRRQRALNYVAKHPELRKALFAQKAPTLR